MLGLQRQLDSFCGCINDGGCLYKCKEANAKQCEPCDENHRQDLLLLHAESGIGLQPHKCDVLKLEARHCTCYCEDVPTKCACEGCDRAEIRVGGHYQIYCLRCGPNSPDSDGRPYTCRCQTRYAGQRHTWDWMLCQCVDDLCKARTRTKIGEFNPLCPRCKECTKSHIYVVNIGTLVEDKRYMHCTCSCPKEDLRVATHDHLYLQATGQQTPVDDRALPPPPPLKSSSRVTRCGCPSDLCHRTDMTHYLFPDGHVCTIPARAPSVALVPVAKSPIATAVVHIER